MKGEGLQLVVHPSRINHITRCFNKDKGLTIELTPQEITMNRSAEMEGAGLFDDIRRGFEDFGEKIKPVADKVGRVALPIAKKIASEGLDKLAEQAPTIGASALTGLALFAGQPELVPFAQMAGRAGGQALGNLARDEGKKAIGGFDPYGQNAPAQSTQAQAQATEDEMISELPLPPRRNGPPSRSSNTNPMLPQKSLADYSVDDLGIEIARRRGGYSSPLDSSGGKKTLAPYVSPVGQGLYAQARGIVGVGGNLIRGGSLPPAMESQPYASNFVMASRLPPAYAQLIRSG